MKTINDIKEAAALDSSNLEIANWPEVRQQGFWRFLVRDKTLQYGLWLTLFFTLQEYFRQYGWSEITGDRLLKSLLYAMAICLLALPLTKVGQWIANERRWQGKPTVTQLEKGVIALLISLLLLAMCYSIYRARYIDIRGAHLTDVSALAQAQGTIVASELHRMRHDWIHPHITYEFQAGGRTFRSSKVTFSCTGGGGNDRAEEYAQKYKVGKPITVFFDRADPTFSVLEPQTADNFYDVLGLAILAVFGVIGSSIYTAKAWHRSKSS
jgi:hypothetical protein